jgi:hypothetical protein
LVHVARRALWTLCYDPLDRAPELEARTPQSGQHSCSVGGVVKYVFLFGDVGVTVLPWLETPDKPEEGGARVEIQRLHEEPTDKFYVARARSLREPIFRADLFTRLAGDAGNWEAAHFHPHFVEDWAPCDRNWDPALTADPRSWIKGKLGNMREILVQGGAADLADSVDQAEVDKALPIVMAAIESCFQPSNSSVAAPV